jgi:hypothetical protein
LLIGPPSSRRPLRLREIEDRVPVGVLYIIGEAELCPGSAALAAINAALR